MNTTQKRFARSRFRLYVELGAISLATTEHGYIYTYLAGISAARRAIRDVRDRDAGIFPRDGLSDAQRREIAGLENEAKFCPITFTGNKRQNELRGQIAAIRSSARKAAPRSGS